MKKIVIIINGVGGAGKDTLCNFAAKHYLIDNISAITPIKDIARRYGWNGEKDPKSRKFLSDLKKAFINYNDLPTKYLLAQYETFLNSNNEILFVHIREKEEIEKFKQLVNIKCITLFVDRHDVNVEKWGNSSDDEVRDYEYDIYFKNDKDLSEIENEFILVLSSLLE